MTSHPTTGQAAADQDKACRGDKYCLSPLIEPSICKLANIRYCESLNHIRNRHAISLMSSTWHPSGGPGKTFQHWMASWKKQVFPPRSHDALFEHHRPHRSSASTAGFHVLTYRDGSYVNSLINSISWESSLETMGDPDQNCAKSFTFQ